MSAPALTPARFDAFARALAETVPELATSVEPEDLATYGRDWTRVYEPRPSLVAFPRSRDEVSRLLALANLHGVPVVPSGGRTGLAGGAVAKDGEVVLSLEKMRHMDPVDVVGATVRVEAGAVTQVVHEHCAPFGLTWPVDFASKGSSHVGGNIATNAGGVKVIRYGLTRTWVLGLEVVLANGEVLELNGALEKNNTGTDLRQLFIGSEGTLGVVTAATLKLTKLPGKLTVALFATPSLANVLRLFAKVRTGPFTLSAYEFFTAECLARLERHRKVRAPFADGSPFYVLVELEHTDEASLEAFVSSVFDEGIVTDGVLAQHEGDARALWELREGISESLSATGLPHKNDISLPIAALEPFCEKLGSVFAERYPGWEICLFGHVGDGNLHVNVMKPDGLEKAAFLAKTKEADADLFTLVAAHGGSVSAEHGIGLLKKAALGYTRSPAEIERMRAIKKAFDPNGILNPGKVLDA
ncbi:MAG: FAD-binding oxidoreductase [Myxococcales bacterium]|nr:FAD-binding oxidoreductase [Myxococcales bacterium]